MDVCNILRGRPIKNGLDLLLCNMHPIVVNLVPKESDGVTEKLTFAQFKVKLILTQPSQHCQDVSQMGSLVRAMNQNVVHVNFDK